MSRSMSGFRLFDLGHASPRGRTPAELTSVPDVKFQPSHDLIGFSTLAPW